MSRGRPSHSLNSSGKLLVWCVSSEGRRLHWAISMEWLTWWTSIWRIIYSRLKRKQARMSWTVGMGVPRRFRVFSIDHEGWYVISVDVREIRRCVREKRSGIHLIVAFREIDQFFGIVRGNVWKLKITSIEMYGMTLTIANVLNWWLYRVLVIISVCNSCFASFLTLICASIQTKTNDFHG